nr:MAG TPA: hypothetical protein [Bacteriophage sp.]
MQRLERQVSKGGLPSQPPMIKYSPDHQTRFTSRRSCGSESYSGTKMCGDMS